ncbi:YkyA family protein [Radiobacillus kanasensis]|uniref:YkyA family protein n=1 Tax=Radiobacillus kanasensis TaxID=2844358 RepID=UPI001E3FDAA5|nr:YkyA family protein [Radiobacillus kanasensis]UFU01359.1 YkyA family protein [Radiobacillus kanasensis]
MKVLGLFLLLMALVACNGESTTEKMFTHMEEAVKLENTFTKQQDPLVELEEKESELYKQIIDLSMDEFEQMKDLASQALDIIDKREEIIQKEKESIEASKEEFDKIKPLIKELKEEKLQKTATQMYEIMDKRYQAYLSLHSAYQEALKKDKMLYSLFQKKELREDELRKQVESVNESYDKVLEANDSFNQFTDEYNKLKEEFYKQSDLDIEISE